MIMMNSAEKEKKSKLSPLESGTAGAFSSFITRVILQPLDVLKIRFQLQVESTKKNKGGLYYGVFQAFKTIYRQEGGKSLWKGHVSAQALTISYGVGQFGTYTFLKELAEDFGYADSGIILSLCGGLAGMMGTLVSMPFDVARTRIIAQSFPEYSGMMDVWRKILMMESTYSLWKGLTPTLLMTFSFAAIQFRMYYFLSGLVSDVGAKEQNVMGTGVTISTVCGAVAGVSAKITVYPLDVLKKRVQIRGSECVRRHFGKVVFYRSIWDCIRRVTVEEGLLAWFKGLKPSLIKSALFSALVFTFYEISCDKVLATKLEREKEN